MVLKRIVFSGLLLASVALAACQPKTTPVQETDTTMMEETPAVMEDESIMMEGTDKPSTLEESLYMDTATDAATPTASPMMDDKMETEPEM